MLNLKILMLVYRQYPYVSANTAIAYMLAEQLRKEYGWEIIFAGHLQDPAQLTQEGYHGFSIVYLDSLNSDRKLERGLFTRIASRLNWFTMEDREYARAVDGLIQSERFDAAVAFCAPDEMVSALYLCMADIPKIMYQMDPYHSLNELNGFRRYARKRRFLAYLKEFRWIFTTKQLYDEYSVDRRILRYIRQVTGVEFPKLIFRQELTCVDAVLRKEPDAVNLLYCGTLYSHIRAPAALLKLSMFPHVKVHFIGGIYGGGEEEILAMLESAGVISYGRRSQQEARQAMGEADVLVNVGNTVANQLPSKLIDYIATGKPILNVYLRDDCPSIKYMQKYPLGLSVAMEDLTKESMNSKILEFCTTYAGRKLDFDTVKALYPECTIEFVASTFKDVLDHVISSNKAVNKR